MCRRLTIFMLILLVFFQSSSLSSQFAAKIAQADSTSACNGENVSNASDIAPPNDISKYRLPFVGFASINQAPNRGHRGPESFDFLVTKIPIVAARSGTVSWGEENHLNESPPKNGYGHFIEIKNDDDDEKSIYAHLSERIAQHGQHVNQGELIAYSGNSGLIASKDGHGYHLHFEVKKQSPDNRYVNIRGLKGIHLFAVDQQQQELNCDISIDGKNFDGYGLGPSAPGIIANDGIAEECKLKFEGVIVYGQDGCQGQVLNTPYNGTVFAGFTQMDFVVSSMYIAPGWSAFIDDGTDQPGEEHNHLCATTSLWDLNLDYFHPVPNRLIAEHVKRVIAFHDTTCGGKNINEHGELISLSQYPLYTDPASNVGGGSNPPPIPRSCENIGQFDTNLAYLWADTNCIGDISWFSGHPANGPSKAGQKSAFVPTGHILYISSDNDGNGEKACLSGSVYSLSDIGWQDKIEWAQIQTGSCPVPSVPETAKARLYRDTDYRSLIYELDPGSWSLAFQDYHSLRMPSGWSTTIHNRQGQELCTDSSQNNLSSQWVNIDWVQVRASSCASVQPVCENLAAPTILTPGAEQLFTNGLVRIGWSSVSGASKYHWQVATNSNFSYLERDMYTSDTSVSTISTLYDWSFYTRVRAEKPECGISSEWSVPVRFLIESKPKSVTVTKVWTTDENLNEMTSYDPGQQMKFIIRYESTAVEPITATVVYDITRDVDGYRFGLWTYETTPATNSNSMVVPYIAANYTGHYTFKGSVEYNGVISQLESYFLINGPDPDPIPTPTCDGINPGTGYYIYRNTNCDGGTNGGGGDLSIFDLVDDHSANLISSIYLDQVTSLRVYNGKNGTGESICISETSPDLSAVLYDNSELSLDDSIESFESFDRKDCKPKELPEYVEPELNKLPAPSGLKPYTQSVMHSGPMNFSWDIVLDAAYYYVWLENIVTGERTSWIVNQNQAVIDQDIKPGPYLWQVQGMIDAGNGRYLDSFGALATGGYVDVLAPPLPGSPLNFRAESDYRTVSLYWDKPNSNEDSFILRRLIDGSFVDIVIGPSEIFTDYFDSSLECGTEYQYEIVSVNITGESVPAYVTVRTKNCANSAPSAPTNLRKYLISKTQIMIMWDDTSPNEDGFVVKKWNGSAFTEVGKVTGGTNSYSDTGLTCGTQYLYVVVSYNRYGQSLNSNELTLNTDGCPDQSEIYLPLVIR